MRYAMRGMLIGAALTLMLASPGRAEPPACKDDIQKFCKDVPRGGGQVGKCLKEHESQLSDACKQHITQRREERGGRRRALRAACEADAKKLCSDVKPGRGAMAKCLRTHASEVSADCKAQLDAPRKGKPAGK